MLIQNSYATQVIRDQAKLTLSEGFPQNLLPNVQPVIDMTPRFHRRADLLKAASRTTSGSATIFQTDAGKDTYITGLIFSVTKDSTCDMATGSVSLSCTVGGIAQTLCTLSVVTLTAQDKEIAIEFPVPIKIDPSTNVTIGSQSFTVGACSRTAQIYGYTTEPM